jgi:glutamate synthase domain-containing protein 2
MAGDHDKPFTVNLTPLHNPVPMGRSQIWTKEVVDDVHVKAEIGRYRMRGYSLFKRIPHWDELTFLPATLTRFVIEGYREKCETRTVLGHRYARKPVELDIPIYITGMSFGALSRRAKTALAMGANMAGSACCSGEGGAMKEERELSKTWFYQILESHYGHNPYDLQQGDMIEFFISQGCKPGAGGHLMGQKVSPEVAGMRDLPPGIDQRSPVRHPDWLGPDDLSLKIQEIREATNWEVPIQLKIGTARAYDDVRMAAKCGPDSILIDGMEGSTGAGPHILTEDTGIPLMAGVVQARKALEDVGLKDEITLVASGGIRNGVDVAKCLALGADACAIGTAALMALNCNKDIPEADYMKEVGVPAGQCYFCHTGKCPVGVTTQDPELEARLDVEGAAQRVYNLLHAMTLECQMITRGCAKTDVHNLEPEDLAALSIEAAAMAQVPLAGTSWIPGISDTAVMQGLHDEIRALRNELRMVGASQEHELTGAFER